MVKYTKKEKLRLGAFIVLNTILAIGIFVCGAIYGYYDALRTMGCG